MEETLCKLRLGNTRTHFSFRRMLFGTLVHDTNQKHLGQLMHITPSMHICANKYMISKLIHNFPHLICYKLVYDTPQNRMHLAQVYTLRSLFSCGIIPVHIGS